MTDKIYFRAPKPTLAHRFVEGETLAKLPQWLRDFSQYGPIGAQSPSIQLGKLMIPTRGNTMPCPPGHWLVLEDYDSNDGKISGGIIGVYGDAEFHESFSEAVLADKPSKTGDVSGAKADDEPPVELLGGVVVDEAAVEGEHIQEGEHAKGDHAAKSHTGRGKAKPATETV